MVIAIFVFVLMIAARSLFDSSDQSTKVDAIILLGGGDGERVKRLIAIFRSEDIPNIIVVGNGDCKISEKLLRDAGIPG